MSKQHKILLAGLTAILTTTVALVDLIGLLRDLFPLADWGFWFVMVTFGFWGTLWGHFLSVATYKPQPPEPDKVALSKSWVLEQMQENYYQGSLTAMDLLARAFTEFGLKGAQHVTLMHRAIYLQEPAAMQAEMVRSGAYTTEQIAEHMASWERAWN
jgi:hypothetical protein